MAEQSKLMKEGMDAYGIAPEHVFASKDFRNHVVIVTKGGSKISYAPGDKVAKLSKVELDGVPPEKPKE